MNRPTVSRSAAVEIVALVTSAGGLEALTVVLSALPARPPVPVVVQQHMSGRPSRLVTILGQRTGLDVVWAEEGAQVLPGQIVVAPPRRALEVLPDGTCTISPDVLHVRDRPHDALLTSLADSYGHRALAVVLTGMGDDGAAGVRALTAAGADVIAQNTDTADQPAMPQAAVAAGAELVLPLHQIGPVVGDIMGGAATPRPSEELDAIRSTFGDEGEIAALALDLDWSTTPVGRVSGWPAELRTVVRLAADAPTPTAVMWGDDHILFVNDAAIEPLSGRHVQAFGRPHRDAFPELWDDIRPLLQRTLQGGRSQVPAFHLPFERNGRLRDAWFDVSLSPIRAADGTVVGVLELFFERTGDVLAARRLHTLNLLSAAVPAASRHAALQAALDVLADSADVLFAAGYLLDRTATRASLVSAVGVAPGTPLAPHDVRITPQTPWPLASAVEHEVWVTDVDARFRGHLVGSDAVRPETALLFPLRDEAAGGAMGVLVLGLDPRLVLDDGCRQFLGSIGETVTAKVVEATARARERSRVEQLAELDRYKTEFFSNVSHDFRTPLTLILAPLAGMLDRTDELPDDVAADLRLVQRNAIRLLRMVGSLLDFSRVEAGRLRATKVAIDLSVLTADIAAMFRSAVEHAGLSFTVDAPPMARTTRVDPELWEKIVANLLSNALKFTWTGGIEVVLRELPNHAELVVRDTGVGIPAEDIGEVFSRFHRVRQSRGRTHDGVGVGLALVDELVRLHHGRLRVHSEPDRGSDFTVWLPYGRDDAPGEAAVAAPAGGFAVAMAREAAEWEPSDECVPEAATVDDVAPARPVPGRDRDPRRVLIVEDNADLRAYLVRLLGATWQVTAVADAVTAMSAADRDHPDLVLADVMMPGMDGITLLKTLRASVATAETPVVLLTARVAEQTAIEALLGGADDYVVKPFSPRELVARVGAQLELGRQRRRSEARWQAVAEMSFDLVYRMDPDWTHLRVLSGQDQLDDGGRPSDSWVHRVVHPDDRAAATEAIAGATASGTVFEFEHRVVRTDATVAWRVSRVVPLLDGHGDIEEWVGTTTHVPVPAVSRATTRNRGGDG